VPRSNVVLAELVSADRPSPEEIRREVARIVDSTDFAASGRASRFLRYVVDETLAGRADRIKAFSVAVEVFGRDESFDPQSDPVVRIEAGRLRRALAHYYLLSGKDDAVSVEIPKGAYVPTFTLRKEVEVSPSLDIVADDRDWRLAWRWHWLLAAIALIAAGSAIVWFAPSRPSIPEIVVFETPRVLVLPFADLGDGRNSGPYAAALTDELVTALSNFHEISVLGVQTSRSLSAELDVQALHESYDVAYLIEGSVLGAGDRIRVNVRLTDIPTGDVLWSHTYENPVTPTEFFSLAARTAGDIAEAIVHTSASQARRRGLRRPTQRFRGRLGARLSRRKWARYESQMARSGRTATNI
jgi:adenylate cyclase